MERTLRIAADLLRAALVTGAIAFVAFSTWHKHMGYALGLMAIFAIAVRFAKAPAVFDFSFMLLLSIDAWATAAGAFENINRDDRPGHILLSAAVTPILFFAAARAKALNDRPQNTPQTIAVGLVAMSMTIALGAIWELVEWQSDLRFGTDMSLGYSDTLGDMVCDVIGGLAGAAIVVFVLTRRRARARALAFAPTRAGEVDDAAQPALAFHAIRE